MSIKKKVETKKKQKKNKTTTNKRRNEKKKKKKKKRRKKKDLQFNTQRQRSNWNLTEDEKKPLEHDQQELIVIARNDGEQVLFRTQKFSLWVGTEIMLEGDQESCEETRKKVRLFW